MKLLGIDPGTARMGYCVLDLSKKGDVVSVIEASVITTPAEFDMHYRLRLIHNSLKNIAKQHSPDVMIIEKLFFNTNVKTAITVGQARGVAMLVAADKKMDLFEYTALQAKLVLTGYGRSDKKAMQEAVMKHLALDNIVKSDDANDAIAIALCFIKKDLESYLKLSEV